MVPKEDGTGIMVSALQSREFGFGFRKLTRDELVRVNASRVEKEYKDTAAAIKIKGSAMKNPLVDGENPFVQLFEYGANNEGYWTYEHLVIQLEDCMDILTVLYPTDKYEIQTLADNSSGHDRQREDGLKVNGMNK